MVRVRNRVSNFFSCRSSCSQGVNAVASLWGTAQGDTLQGVTPEGKKLWANLQRIVGDTRVKAIKSDSDSDSDDQKRSSGFSGKNRGVTPSVAAPGVTHPSDATG